MVDETQQSDEDLLMILVMNFHQMAMIGMGKLVNPSTGKAARDLPQARFAIDMLEMLARRTKSNLSMAAEASLQHLLTQLRLNYVDEAAKPEPDAATTGTAPPAAGPGAAGPIPEASQP